MGRLVTIAPRRQSFSSEIADAARSYDRMALKRDPETWRHEDQLVNHRLTWTLTAQALLIGGYVKLALERSGLTMATTTEFSHIGDTAMRCAPWLGFALSVAMLVGIAAAQIAQASMVLPGEQLGIRTSTTLMGWAASLAIPALFATVWALFLPLERHPVWQAIAAWVPIIAACANIGCACWMAKNRSKRPVAAVRSVPDISPKPGSAAEDSKEQDPTG
jgi:hypothetical protein